MTALDTNVLVMLWQPEAEPHGSALAALTAERRGGSLMISAAVYAELLAGPRDENFLDSFCSATGIEVDWDFPADLWRSAGSHFHRFCQREGAQRRPRRILADFLIATHAAARCGRLLTFDHGMGALGIPGLEVIAL